LKWPHRAAPSIALVVHLSVRCLCSHFDNEQIAVACSAIHRFGCTPLTSVHIIASRAVHCLRRTPFSVVVVKKLDNFKMPVRRGAIHCIGGAANVVIVLLEPLDHLYVSICRRSVHCRTSSAFLTLPKEIFGHTHVIVARCVVRCTTSASFGAVLVKELDDPQVAFASSSIHPSGRASIRGTGTGVDPMRSFEVPLLAAMSMTRAKHRSPLTL